MRGGYYYLLGSLPATPVPENEAGPWGRTRVVGQGLPRVDAYERVSGSAVYPSDVRLPGMLFGAILRCPYPHARVKRVDTSRAERMPGVRAVVAGATSGADIPWYGEGGETLARLFDTHCRFEGDAVAAVAAETPHEAWDALRSITVDYEVLPFIVDEERALEPGAPEVRRGGNRAGEPEVYERGDVGRGFAAAEVVLEETYRTACQIHAPLEPHGCVARWEGGKLTVWESTQGVYSVQSRLAGALGLPLANIRVIGHYVGGGFGSKLAPGKFSVIAALLAKRAGRPVKLFLTREETFLSMGNRPANRMRLRAGVKRDGTLTALEMDVHGSGGAYSAEGTSLVDWQVRDLYLCPNVRTVAQSVYIHAGEERPMRAPGHPQGSWALEQMMDALAERIGMDPVELRLRNLATVSQGRGGTPYTSTGLRECLEQGARAFGWSEARRRKRGDGPIMRGVGVAGCLWIAGGGGPPSTALVQVFSDGSASLNMGASDIGTGTKTVMAMVVAEELGVPLDRIRIEHADTATTQFATPSGGSKTVPTEAPAVREAALECRRQLLAMAARQLRLPAAELALEGGAVVSTRDPAVRLPATEIEELRRSRTVSGTGHRGPNPGGKAICPFGAQFCEVEVNTRTGELRLVRLLGAHDSGRVMNRLTYDSQVHGGIVMGIGFAMTERRVLDRAQTGKMVNLNWHDYKIPTALDVPAEVVSLPIELPDPECNTAGAKGLGEPVTIPTAAAIANAIHHATGLRVTEAPVNPTRLVELLAARKGRARGG
jgi:xanthine dehydrogenase YagR molybdenum-binding subunit